MGVNQKLVNLLIVQNVDINGKQNKRDIFAVVSVKDILGV